MVILKITALDVPEPQGSIYSNCFKVGKQIFISGMVAAAVQAACPAEGEKSRKSYLLDLSVPIV
jgi:hypothetical protein